MDEFSAFVSIARAIESSKIQEICSLEGKKKYNIVNLTSWSVAYVIPNLKELFSNPRKLKVVGT